MGDLNAMVGFYNSLLGYAMRKYGLGDYKGGGGGWLSIASTAFSLEEHLSRNESAMKSVDCQLAASIRTISSSTPRSEANLRFIVKMCRTKKALKSASNETTT